MGSSAVGRACAPLVDLLSQRSRALVANDVRAWRSTVADPGRGFGADDSARFALMASLPLIVSVGSVNPVLSTTPTGPGGSTASLAPVAPATPDTLALSLIHISEPTRPY